MSLNARKQLGTAYIGVPQARGCGMTPDRCRKGVSRQPWVVLLQSRS